MIEVSPRQFRQEVSKHLDLVASGTRVVILDGENAFEVIKIKQVVPQEKIKEIVEAKKPGIKGIPYGGYDNLEDQPFDPASGVFKINVWGSEFIPVRNMKRDASGAAV